MGRCIKPIPVLVLLLACVGCAPPPATVAAGGLAHGAFVLAVAPDPGSARPAVASAGPTGEQPRGGDLPERAEASPQAVATPPVASSSGGGSSGGGGSGPGPSSTGAPAGPTAHVTLPGGQVLELPAGDAVALPAGTNGDVMLDVPGQVPSTVQAGGTALAVHPRPASALDLPTGLAHLTGGVTPAVGGLTVQLLLPGRTDFMGAATQPDGSFAFDAPVAAATQGLVLAREALDAPRLALQRVTVAPGATTGVAALDLEDAGPDGNAYHVLGGGNGAPAAFPALPLDMGYDAAQLQVIEAQPSPWVATLISNGSLLVPTYALPGFTQVTLLRASNPDHTKGLTLVGQPKAFPAPLLPPDLSGLAGAPASGDTLTWPAVAGASLYVARLYAADVPDPPLWEGLTTSTHLPLPAGMAPPGAGCSLQVDAWDVPGMSVYTVATAEGPRRFRVPAEPNALGGRHSWARKAF